MCLPKAFGFSYKATVEARNGSINQVWIQIVMVGRIYLADSWTSWPAALGVLKDISIAAKDFGSGSICRIHNNPGI